MKCVGQEVHDNGPAPVDVSNDIEKYENYENMSGFIKMK